jgi:hypothetical protein
MDDADDLFESAQNGQLEQVTKILQNNLQNINATNHVRKPANLSIKRLMFL